MSSPNTATAASPTRPAEGPWPGLIIHALAVVTFFHGPEVIVHAEDMPSMAEVGTRIMDEWLWVPVLLLVGSYISDFIPKFGVTA